MTRQQKSSFMTRNSTVEFLTFASQAEENGIEVQYADDTVWLTRKMMAELFAVSLSTMTKS